MQEIPIEPPIKSSVRSAWTEIVIALVTLEELAPRRLQGYGEISPEDEETLDKIENDLKGLLRGIETFLARDSKRALLPNLQDQSQMVPVVRESALQAH